MKEQLKAALAEYLVELGWTHDPRGSAIASKMYATAVGDKQALVYLADFGADCELMLQGQYYSEGRNALESRCMLLSRTATPEHVRHVAAEFARRADAAIAQTYAARLLNPVAA